MPATQLEIGTKLRLDDLAAACRCGHGLDMVCEPCGAEKRSLIAELHQ